VVENVEIPLLLNGFEAPAARAAALHMLASMELTQIADKLPEEISGGQAQRIAVARSLVHAPQLVLADEPTGQLDHDTAKHVLDLLLANLGPETALVIATHDLAVAARMKTTWTMDHGFLKN
jgi:putative ABC transport system ATP-binding protein/lipoprotein-releasing system ATP-binding protein